MFTLNSRMQFIIRVLLIAVTLFNALAPTTLVAKAKQEAGSAVSPASLEAVSENDSISANEQPEPSAGERISDVAALNTKNTSSNTKALKNNINHPVMFIENVGQFDPQALFVASSSNANIFLSQNEIWFTIIEKTKKDGLDRQVIESQINQQKKKTVNLKMVFPGSNPAPKIEAFDKLDIQVSHFIGNDSTKHFADVPVWGGIRYVEIYPGADLELTSENGVFVWHILVRDSVKFSQDNYLRSHGLSIKFAGQKNLNLQDGGVKIDTELGKRILPQMSVTGAIDNTFFTSTPKIIGDELFLVYPKNLSFESENSNLFKSTSFRDEQSNQNNLVQTQEASSNVVFHTVFGGEDWEESWGQAAGPDGSMFVTGWSDSIDWPTSGIGPGHNGEGDAFVVKINPDGSTAYAIYIGGSFFESGQTIAVNDQGEVYVAGGRASYDFPVTTNAFAVGNPPAPAGFLLKLNASGNALLYSSFIGDPGAYIIGMGIDADDDIYLLDQNGIAYKVILGNSSYSYRYDLGPTDWPGWTSIAVAANGIAYFVGNAANNVLVTAIPTTIPTTGTVPIYSISIDGGQGSGIAVDENGYAYITGTTGSPDFPTLGNALTPPFPDRVGCLCHHSEPEWNNQVQFLFGLRTSRRTWRVNCG